VGRVHYRILPGGGIARRRCYGRGEPIAPAPLERVIALVVRPLSVSQSRARACSSSRWKAGHRACSPADRCEMRGFGEWEVRGEGQGRDSLSLAHACHGVWSRGWSCPLGGSRRFRPVSHALWLSRRKAWQPVDQLAVFDPNEGWTSRDWTSRWAEPVRSSRWGSGGSPVGSGRLLAWVGGWLGKRTKTRLP
jgi:hypothetical protein